MVAMDGAVFFGPYHFTVTAVDRPFSPVLSMAL